MWYGDFIPRWGYHPKKLLSPKQLKKLRKAYAQAPKIRQYVSDKEAKEKKSIEDKMNASLEDIPL